MSFIKKLNSMVNRHMDETTSKKGKGHCNEEKGRCSFPPECKTKDKRERK